MASLVNQPESPTKSDGETTTPRGTPHGTLKVAFQITTPKGRQQEESSPSTSSSSDSSTDTDAGARLTDNDFDDSPIVSNHVKKEPKSPTRASSGVGFQLGSRPSGDIFLSPVKQRQTSATADAVRLALEAPLPPRNLRYRSSDITAKQRLGDVDAQGLYPQSSCVFVANLPEGKDDRALEAALTREFSKYGTVFVKIRRDGHNMPFAFCQYTNDTDARTAMENGKGTQILGRACRTEMVRANRSFIVQKRDGSSISVSHVHSLMEPYGDLDKCEPLNNATYGVPTILIQFRMYDPSRDLVNIFRVSRQHRVQVFDPTGRNSMRSRNPDENFMARYEVDRRSVFVGNLYENVTKEELATLFDDIGDINDIQVMKKSLGTVGHRVYAFVEFSQIDMPEAAIARFHDSMFQGCKLRIERKVGRPLTNGPRRVQSQVLPKHRSPATPADPVVPPAPRPAAAQTTPSAAFPANFMPFGGHAFGSPLAYYGPSARMAPPPSPWFAPPTWGFMQDGMGMYYPCPSPTAAVAPAPPAVPAPAPNTGHNGEGKNVGDGNSTHGH